MRVIIALTLGSLGVAFVYSGVSGSGFNLFSGFFGSKAGAKALADNQAASAATWQAVNNLATTGTTTGTWGTGATPVQSPGGQPGGIIVGGA